MRLRRTSSPDKREQFVPERRSTLLNGWYGLIQIGDGWRPLTIPENWRSLMVSEGRKAGATHVGYWDGRDWIHIEAVD